MKEDSASLNDKYFIPVSDEETLPLPETYTDASDEQLESSELASFTLKPHKIRFLSRFLKLSLLLVLLISSWEMFVFIQTLNQWHWSLAYLMASFMVILLVHLLLVIRSYQQQQQERESVKKFQMFSQRMREEKTFGQASQFIDDLKKLYSGKPQEPFLQQALEQLPDYNNDVEVLDHLSEHFFNSLDKQALAVVSRYSRQTGLLVALSPLAIADMLLSLWRILKMIDEIGQVYGLRPSLPGRLRLLKELASAMVLAGGTELATDAIADFSTSSVAGVVSSRIGQGIGVGLYVARIGVRTMDLCRPVARQTDERPGIKGLLAGIKSFIQEKMTGKTA